ncbi:baculoviral IAP repeat-containing protein 7-B-like [Cloeon dipterum]|uniref:baculoviral IAP repeat-containing protein 7-B-like n=1 Tax=Cloeon dipterum TaxID=197152 RepID=UPI0032203971
MTDNVPLNETGSGVLIDLGEDDDNNYEIVTITSSDDDDEDVVGDVCGIYKYPPGRFNHPFSGPGELAPGKVDNVELDINASHGAVSHRQPIHPSYQTVQARMMASSSQETEAEESCRSRAKPQCKVCLDGDVRVVFLPCGHLVTCVQCAPNFSLCPICRTEIKATVRAYFAE